jgi:hypothetical protein
LTHWNIAYSETGYWPLPGNQGPAGRRGHAPYAGYRQPETEAWVRRPTGEGWTLKETSPQGCALPLLTIGPEPQKRELSHFKSLIVP